MLRDIDLLGNDFAMGTPGTCGKDGQGVPVGDGQPTLRVKALTIGGRPPRPASEPSEGPGRPLELAKGIAGRAGNGEQIEAYVAAANGTVGRAYEGEVEHFTRPSRGRRHPGRADGRMGFAYAGTLDRRRGPRCWPRPGTT